MKTVIYLVNRVSAGPHISQLYITQCHSPPASQSALGAWRGDVIAMVASHALLPSGDDVTDFPIGVKLNFIYITRDKNFIFKSDEVWLLSVILTYNCIVIPPSNMFVSFVTPCNFRIIAYFRIQCRRPRWPSDLEGVNGVSNIAGSIPVGAAGLTFHRCGHCEFFLSSISTIAMCYFGTQLCDYIP